jgi:hypothetical protein
MVMVLDPDRRRHLRISPKACGTKVAGIVSGAKDTRPGTRAGRAAGRPDIGRLGTPRPFQGRG